MKSQAALENFINTINGMPTITMAA